MRFYDVGSDINWRDYGGKWAAREYYRTFKPKNKTYPLNGVVLNVVEFINWEDATGEKTVDGNKYAVQTYSIDGAFYSQDQINDALDCCGQPHTETDWRNLAYVMSSYGYGDSRTYYGNNAHKLMKLAKGSF